MAVTTTKTNKPINPRGNDQSPKGYNRAALYSGKALDFDGVNDTLSTDYAPSSNIQTTAYWVKLDSLTTSYVLGGFVQGTTNQFGLYYWGGEASKNFGFNTWNADSYGITLPDFVEDWFHVVAEYNFSDFTQSKLFVNGQELSISQTKGTTLQRTTASRAFKIDSPNTSQEMNGKISGVKVFEGSLTAAQVSDLYNNPEKVVPTGVEDTALKLWLPMMEGAGTTAYDGSGNGNHGTISGATWTHGVGAPVAQSAVIDWNKGENYTLNSNNFNTSWTKARATLTSGQSGILGSNDAWKIESNATGFTGAYQNTALINSVACSSIYAKAGNVNYIFISSPRGDTDNAQYFDLSTGSIATKVGTDITSANIEAIGTDGWYRCSVISSAIPSIGYMLFGVANTDANASTDSSEYIYIQNAQFESTELGPYIPTLSTAQTSPVLLAQGLTTGRDITGVNLFENVRKQGALNLDGNSWAEVHDNGSLDITDAVSLEMWIYWEDQSAETTILGKWVGGADRAYALIATTTTGRVDFRQRVSSTTYTMGISTLSNGWNHLVATHDHSANERLGYINGVLVSTATSQGVSNESDNNITIGGISTAQYTNSIAQPRIYNRALTAEEVQRNYDAGKNIYTNS